MSEKTKVSKYKDYKYDEDIQKILNIKLSDKEKKKLQEICESFKKRSLNRNYECLIPDLFIFCEKYKLSTKELADIYNVSLRTIQTWLKELGLNKSKSKTKKLKNNKKEKVTISEPKIENKNNFIEDSYDFFNNTQYQFSQKGPQSLWDFLSYLETIKGKSSNTITAYKIDLILFFKFLKAYKKGLPKGVELLELDISDLDDEFVKEVKLRDLYAFLSYVEKARKNSNYAKSRKVAALKSYFKFLQTKIKIISENPANELETPKIEKRNPIYLTLEESLQLIESLDKTSKNYDRDYCILILFLNCGMRLSELCNIKISKFKEDKLSIVGKGDKERVVYLNKACIEAINNHLKTRDTSKVDDEFKDYMFLSSRNRPINKRTVELLVKKYSKNAGLGEKYTPHKLRHTAATLMYKHGEVDIRSIQNILGHENISTTQIYTHVDDDDLREAVNKNPLASI